MPKTCVSCAGNGLYKCPVCYIFYCSTKCCKKHRESGCQLTQKMETDPTTSVVENNPEKLKEPLKSRGEVSAERLELLKSSEEVKNLLTNPHLRELLVKLDNAENAEEVVQKAMLEPIFVEFADACINAVEPSSEGDQQDHT